MALLGQISVLALAGFGYLSDVQKIDQVLCQNDFQGAALIAKQGKILFVKGYGMANAEHQIPNTPSTVFRIGSITKQFTAVAILQLQESGKLNVHDPIANYLPDYPCGDRITIHHLLSHTAGIPSVTRLPNIAEIQRHPTEPIQVMRYFKHLPLEFAPGTDCHYSNSGYIVLGAIIEAVTGKSYESYVQEHFLTPLAMHATYVDRNQRLIPNRANGYSVDANGNVVNAEFVEMSFPHAAGAMASTVHDLFVWDCALQGDRLLTSESRARLFQVQGSSDKNCIQYGYGFFVDPANHSVGHMGSIEGFRAASYRTTKDGITIIILSNREETNAVEIQQMLHALLSQRWRR